MAQAAEPIAQQQKPKQSPAWPSRGRAGVLGWSPLPDRVMEGTRAGGPWLGGQGVIGRTCNDPGV